MKCSKCGTMNSVGMRFCGNCGASLQVAPLSTTTSATPSLNPNKVYFWGVGVPTWLGLLIVLCVACVVFSCIGILGLAGGGSPTPSAVEDGDTAQSVKTTAPQPVKATSKNYRVGDVVAKENWEYLVTSVSKTKNFVWSSSGLKTDAQGIFVIVYLTLKNIGKSNFSIHTWDFTLRDANNIEYKTTDASGIYSFYDFLKLNKLGSQFVPGLPVDTALVFDINPSAKGLSLYLVQAKTSIDLGQ